MKKITLATLLLFPLFAFSQAFEWLKTPPINFSWNPQLIGYITHVDVAGNVYFAGFKDHQFAYTEIMGEIYFNKYDASGELLFAKTLTGNVSVRDMVSDSQGNTYLVVDYVATLGVGDLVLLTNLQGEQPMLLKFNPQGDLIWHYQPETNGEPVLYCKAIAIDASDNLYIGYNDYENSYVTKMTPDATVLSTIVQHHSRMISSLSVDNQGNIYTAGSCADLNSEYAGIPRPAPTGYNIYLAKYDAQGNNQWVNYVEDVTCPLPQVRAFSPDAVYFSSQLFGSYTFGNLTAEGPVQGQSDIFIAKLNADGDYQWLREVPGNGQLETGTRNYLHLDTQGNVYFSGLTRWTVNWSDELTTATLGFSADAILLKYDSIGNILMAQTVGGDSEDRFDNMAIGPNGSIYLTGMSYGPANFGNIHHDAPQFTAYPFLVKFDSTLATAQNEAAAVGLFPNPAKGEFFLMGLTAKKEGIIYNMLGQEMTRFTAQNIIPIDVSGLSKGTYLIKMEGGISLKLLKL